MMKKIKEVVIDAASGGVIQNDGGAINYQITLIGGDAGTVALYAQATKNSDFEPVLPSADSSDALTFDFASLKTATLNGYSISAFKFVPTGVTSDFTAVVYSW